VLVEVFLKHHVDLIAIIAHFDSAVELIEVISDYLLFLPAHT
jgi:hypothetical protein